MLLRCALAGLTALVAANIYAGTKDELEPSQECTGLKIGTGPKGKGYSKLFTDIDKMCGNVVQVCEVTSNGAVDNLTNLSTNDIDVGLTAVDAAMYMQGGDENVRELQAVMSINYNFLHILVNSNGYQVETKKWGGMKKDVSVEYIRKFTDLRGKVVATVGSGALMGQKLNDMMSMGMTLVAAKTDEEAFAKLKKGEVHGVFTVSGWPSGPVSNLQQSSGLTLVPFDTAVSPPYYMKPVNYKNLGVYNVQSIAVPNILVTRPFKAGGEKAVMVSKLKTCLVNNLTKFQEGSYQAAWKEAKDPENVFGWNKFQAAGATRTAKK